MLNFFLQLQGMKKLIKGNYLFRSTLPLLWRG